MRIEFSEEIELLKKTQNEIQLETKNSTSERGCSGLPCFGVCRVENRATGSKLSLDLDYPNRESELLAREHPEVPKTMQMLAISLACPAEPDSEALVPKITSQICF